MNNEFRYTAGENLEKLMKDGEKLSKLCEDVFREISYYVNDTFKELSNVSQVFDEAAKAYEVPEFWMLEEHTQEFLNKINWQLEHQEDYLNFRNQVITLQNKIKELDEEADFSAYDNLLTVSEIEKYQSMLDDFIEKRADYSAWKERDNIDQINLLYQEFSQVVNEYQTLQKEIESSFEPEIFQLDYNSIYLRFKSKYTSFGRFFNLQYYRDKKNIQGLYRETGKKLSDMEILDILGKFRRREEQENWMNKHSEELNSLFSEGYLGVDTDFCKLRTRIDAWKLMKECERELKILQQKAAEIEAKEERTKKAFAFLYRGLETDWEEIKKALVWSKNFKNVLGKTLNHNEAFVKKVCGRKIDAECLNHWKQMFSSALEEAKPQFQWFCGCFEHPEEFYVMGMKELIKRLGECKSGFSELEEWMDYYVLRKNCCSLGLKDYMDKLDHREISPENIVSVFQKRFFNLWLDSIFDEFPVVAGFRSKIQNHTIKEFQYLDKKQFEIAQLRIRSKLISGLSSINFWGSGINEYRILKKELGKKRRIMPLRRLFREIPNLILTLKPCLMMSPLSVSMFLESGSFTFDTVIFDEASQVCTENAIGAIFRGKQVIIAGDSKQLPPTNFFTAAASDNDFDHDEDSDDEMDDGTSYESVLDEAVLLPECTLLWHYRSRHEHLIAFSNAKIYNNQLVTFPSNEEKKANIGVEYIYVPEGRYDRGGRNGNVIEAAKVADLVFEHFRKFPERSLGIIAFGEVQQQAIDTEVRNRRMKNSSFEKFFSEDRQAPFFIKSLENVQGDERDTIIFSIGYAKDTNGVMKMLFGPLGLSGGERRLNVAITRAKYNVKLVGSILPGDIDVNRISSEGPKLLRDYIDFAIHGPSVLGMEEKSKKTGDNDSLFEQVVCRFLESRGYAVATHVGCSSYQIDIAVKHPVLSGQYIMGIECDGDAYHSARTARERDRLRGDMLKLMGWELYHIWSVDWVRYPVREGQHLIDAIEAALSVYKKNSIDTSGIKESRVRS